MTVGGIDDVWESEGQNDRERPGVNPRLYADCSGRVLPRSTIPMERLVRVHDFFLLVLGGDVGKNSSGSGSCM
jgi:hypothetical protein